jgi:hypothetical protein
MSALPFPLPPGAPLRAGPLSFIFESDRIRSIALGDAELVRRIYPALRDEFWNTIPGEIANLVVAETADSCSVTFDSRHRRGPIDFLWRCTITGSPDGRLTFSMDGTALTSFKRKRIGLCVLHAAALYKGKPCRVETADGRIVQSAFPLTIAPHQPFTDLRSLGWETDDGATATIRFEGDAFATEDQRNWTDATFKTYGPSVDAAGGELLERGAVVRQTVTLSLAGPVRFPVRGTVPRLRLDFRASPLSDVMPRLGCLVDAGGAASGYDFPFAHARIDVRPGEADGDAAVSVAAFLGKGQAAPVECAIHFTGRATAEAAAVAHAFGASGVRVARFLLYHASGPAALGPLLPGAATTLRAAFPNAELFAGTNGYFVDINRARPPLDAVDGVCWCATPQVHTFDAVAVMENMPGLLETLVGGRAIAPGKKIALSPLTLRPRRNPLLPHKDGGADERRATLFAAAWMLGSIAYCIEGGLDSLTLGPPGGEEGVLCSDAGLYPSGILAAWLSPFMGAPAQCRFSTDPSRLIGMELGGGDAFTGIAANCTGEQIAAEFCGLPPGCRYAVLDGGAFERVKRMDDPANSLPMQAVPDGKDSIRLEVPGYALVKFADGQSGIQE